MDWNHQLNKNVLQQSQKARQESHGGSTFLLVGKVLKKNSQTCISHMNIYTNRRQPNCSLCWSDLCCKRLIASGEGDTGGMMDTHAEDSARSEENFPDVTHHNEDGSNGNLILENGLSDGNQGPADTHDQLLQMVMDLRFQNDFLKSQFEGFKNVDSVHSVYIYIYI